MDSIKANRESTPAASRYGVFRPAAVTLRPDRILRVHGYKDPAKVRSVIRETAENIGRRAEILFVPEVHYRRLAIRSLRDADLAVEGGLVFRSEAFLHFLSEAREIVVAVATMGAALDRDVIAHMDRFEPLEALFLETAGWLGIENLTMQFGGFLREQARKEGYRVTCRLGPGYEYKVSGRPVAWPLEEQERIFAAFEGVGLPVTLHPSCVMVPKMSRTGMFGLAPIH
ncbi:MAG: hypothetical protein IT564_05315 [Rhodospirillales bacterium]|nr:hypothetical protein [Rhodospirillales bacterium]